MARSVMHVERVHFRTRHRHHLDAVPERVMHRARVMTMPVHGPRERDRERPGGERRGEPCQARSLRRDFGEERLHASRIPSHSSRA